MVANPRTPNSNQAERVALSVNAKEADDVEQGANFSSRRRDFER
jgi:hypothetical protein